MTESLLLIAPMRTEARLLRRGAADAHVATSGVGPRRARSAAARFAATPASAVAVVGFGGALAPALEPGDVVVATDLRRRDGMIVAECPGAGIIAGALERAGVSARAAPVVSVRGPVVGDRRRRQLHEASGAAAADMESAWLARAAAGRPFAVLRAVLDSPKKLGPRAAAGSLQKAAATLAEWAAAIATREIVVAAPRASCAGVERAIDVVEMALDREMR